MIHKKQKKHINFNIHQKITRKSELLSLTQTENHKLVWFDSKTRKWAYSGNKKIEIRFSERERSER